jgi:hypothetical protein
LSAINSMPGEKANNGYLNTIDDKKRESLSG